MKTNFLYVGAAVVFAVLVIVYSAATSNLSEEIANISGDKKVEIISEELVVRFPVNLEFKRPEVLNKVRFTPVKFSHFDHQDVNCAKCHHTWDGKIPDQELCRC